MIVHCPKCSKNNPSSFGNNYLYFSCAKCKRLFVFNSNNWQLLKSLRKNIHTILVLGQKGILNSIEYTVTGILIKKVNQFYEWTEYILQSETLDFIYLSEYKGHWTILKEVEDLIEVKNNLKINYPLLLIQNLNQINDKKVISYYLCLSGPDLNLERKNLFNKTENYWRNYILNNLKNHTLI